MFEKRNEFFNAIESRLSSAVLLLSNPEKLNINLRDLHLFLQQNWSTIFASLNENPLNKNEIIKLKNFINKIENLNKKVGFKISFFNDFQNYMKKTIEK